MKYKNDSTRILRTQFEEHEERQFDNMSQDSMDQIDELLSFSHQIEKRQDFVHDYKKDIKNILQKKNEETAHQRKYEFPHDDHHADGRDIEPNIKSKNL